jgi:excisionase family DNA binding protein
MGDKLLSVAEAAEVLGVHRTRINQLIDSGDLPASRIGRAYAVRENDLELVRERPAPGRPPKVEGEQATTAQAHAPALKPAKKRAAKKTAKKTTKKAS